MKKRGDLIGVGTVYTASLEEENKALKNVIKELHNEIDVQDNENTNLVIEVEELRKENHLLKMSLEEKDENCYWLAKENKKLKEKLNKIQEAYIRFEKLDSQFQKWLGELDQLIMNR